MEDLTTVATADEVGAVLIEPTRICETHLLMGRADHHATKMPTEVDMDRQTLHLEGRWRSAKTAPWTAFMWRSDVGWGAVHALPTAHDTAAGGVELTMERPLAKLFDHIDPAVATELAAARQVLENAVQGAVVRARLHLH